jgi:hypothetical protein
METKQQQPNTFYERSTFWGNSSSETMGDELAKGAFSRAEVDILKRAMCDFARLRDMSERELTQLVSSGNVPLESKGLWEFLRSRLPTRSTQSIKSFCQRRFNPHNYRGKWSREEVSQLVALVQQYGCRWQKLSHMLQRTPTNIRDKWRTLGDCNYRERNCQKVWSVEEILKLFRLIENTLSMRILAPVTDEPVIEEFVRFKERFPLLHSGRDNKHLNSLCRKIMCSFLTTEAVNSIATAKIKWNLIAKTMETKSKDDCRNYWRSQIIKEVASANTLQKRNVGKFLRELQRAGYKSAQSINWTIITFPQAQFVWEHVRSLVPEGDDLQQIAREYSQRSKRVDEKKYEKHQTDLSRNELLVFFRENAN